MRRAEKRMSLGLKAQALHHHPKGEENQPNLVTVVCLGFYSQALVSGDDATIAAAWG